MARACSSFFPLSPTFSDLPRPYLAFLCQVDGTWIEPLGLKGFAVIDPQFSLYLLMPSTVPTAPVPRSLSWSLKLLWAKPGTEWPDFLRRRGASSRLAMKKARTTA